MKSYKPIFLFLMFLLFHLSTKYVWGDEIKVFVSPPSLTMEGIGEEATIDVKIEKTKEIESIKTFEVFLDYNPEVLEVIEVSEGKLFTKSGHPTFWYFYKDELNEHIHVVDAILGFGLDVEADGVLFSFKVKTLVENGVSGLNLEQVKIGVLTEDRSKVVYVPSVSKGNGTIIVGKPAMLSVAINPAKITVPENSTFEAKIEIEDAVDVSEVQFSLAFESEYLKNIAVTEGEFFRQGDADVDVSVTSEQDNLIICNFKRLSDSGANGEGVIAEISAECIKIGKSTLEVKDITLSEVEPIIKKSKLGITCIKTDVNGDGTTDVLDFFLIAQELSNESPNPDADVNDDGVFDISDLVLIGRNLIFNQ